MRINIYGGPGTGKSTLAALIFHELKKKQISVELITEYIKSWAWQKIAPTSWDQFYVFAKQLRAEDLILRHGYPHLVTDSPLFHPIAYLEKSAPFYTAIVDLARTFEIQYPSVNVLIERSVPYVQEGRYQDEVAAALIDCRIENLLDMYHISYSRFNPSKEDPFEFVNDWLLPILRAYQDQPKGKLNDYYYRGSDYSENRPATQEAEPQAETAESKETLVENVGQLLLGQVWGSYSIY